MSKNVSRTSKFHRTVTRVATFHRKVTGVAKFNMLNTIPAGAIKDDNGNYIFDDQGNYIVLG